MPARRLFVAVDISDEARRRITERIESLRNLATDVRVGWERPEKLHITLKFLGNVDEDKVSEISDITTAVGAANRPFVASLVKAGVYPNARQPRVLWFGVEDGGSTAGLASELDACLQTLGFEAEKRKFNPHLTVARIREPQKGKRLAESHLQSRFEPIQFTISEMVVYESVLKPTGSVYSVVSKHVLSPAVTSSPNTSQSPQ